MSDIQKAKDAVLADPTDAKCHYELGRLLFAAADDRGALAAFDQSIALDASYPHAHFRRALCLGQLGDLEGARRGYLAAIAIDASHWHFHYELGQVHKLLGAVAEAETSLRESIARDANQAPVHHALAQLLSERGQDGEAAAAWHKAVALEPTHVGAHYNLGIFMLHGAGADPAQALAHFQAVASAEPTDWQAHAKVVQALMRLGRVEEATSVRQRASALVIAAFERGEVRVPEFCVDQFAADGATVFVYESAVPKLPGRAVEVWFSFRVNRDAAVVAVFQLEASDYARERGAAPFLLGVRYPDGSHATLNAAWREVPPYRDLKQAVIAAMSPNAAPPLATSRRG